MVKGGVRGGVRRHVLLVVVGMGMGGVSRGGDGGVREVVLRLYFNPETTETLTYIWLNFLHRERERGGADD